MSRPSAASQPRLESVVTPKQARSEETLRRILEAAESLIEEKGLADASIPEIVRRAGSSVGGFYARLQDKNALLRALEERFFSDLSERLERLADAQRWRAASLPEIVAACAEELVCVTRQRRNLIQAFLFRASQDPEFQHAALRFRNRASKRISQLLLQRHEEFRHPDPLVAIDLAVQLGFGLMFQMVLAGELRAGGRALGDAELKKELQVNFLRYLGSDADPKNPFPSRRSRS
ncbi:MAG TPA: TetR/AcrR family transcriptional regulator [Myxococcota bacterium]|nr:TetR/AcrR family transcriptional regulator [Myxococcota bacterium]